MCGVKDVRERSHLLKGQRLEITRYGCVAQNALFLIKVGIEIIPKEGTWLSYFLYDATSCRRQRVIHDQINDAQ